MEGIEQSEDRSEITIFRAQTREEWLVRVIDALRPFYTVRTTRMWIQVGFPYCPCGVRMAKAEAVHHPLHKPEQFGAVNASRTEGRGGK
jgi:hypothetical protein